MARKNTLRLHYTDKKSGAGLQTLRSDTVPPKELWCIQRYVCEGSTATSGGNTRARTYIDGHGYKHYVSEKDSPSAATLYEDTDPIWLYEGECLAQEWDNAADGNVLDLYMNGYREEI